MKLLNKPEKSVEEILEILKGETRRVTVKSDIDSINQVLVEGESLFIDKVEDNTLFEIPREQTISSRVSKNKILSYYTYRLLEKQNGRMFYDEIISSSPYDICPYCTIKEVKTVDHFLPKSEYPIYSITPVNLVPSCRDCNSDKMISYPTKKDDQTFHPYFDDVELDHWLKAVLLQLDPLTFQYKVVKPTQWNEIKFNRAISHYKAYNINQLFSNEANRELRGMQHWFKSLFKKDPNQLKEHLVGTFTSCLAGSGIIDWKTLMYQELSTNRWFLNGCSGNPYFQ